jgi:hypothetical protein
MDRGNQRRWFKGLRRQVQFHLGSSWPGDLLDGFDLLSIHGICAVSCSIKSETLIALV